MVTAVTFMISMAAFAAFGGAFWQNASNYWLGGTLGVGMAFFGIAFVAWGKYLMPQGPFEEPRALMTVTEEQHANSSRTSRAAARWPIERRGFLVVVMGARRRGLRHRRRSSPRCARSARCRRTSSTRRPGREGSYLATIDGRRMHVDGRRVGGDRHRLPRGRPRRRLLPDGARPPRSRRRHHDKPGRETWGPHGYLAFSKVCTHAGCPVGLYEQLTEQLLCPCHQSLFVLRKGAVPIFGPAPRPLPQLPLYVDADGYLRAQAGYDEPIGPGFWERGGTT